VKAPVALGIAAIAVVVAGCGSTNKVGNAALLNIKEKTGGGFETTTSTTASPGTLPPPVGATAPPATRPQATTTTLSAAERKAITAVINIEPDTQLSQFDPSSQAAYPGTPIEWINRDVKARSVVSDDGVTFDSGSIQPGGTFTWVAWNRLGRINYHDGTRPYAVADIEVITRP